MSGSTPKRKWRRGTGNRRGRAKDKQAETLRVARRVQALELYTQRVEYRAIAAQLGISVSTAHADVLQALGEKQDAALDVVRREAVLTFQLVRDAHLAKACAGSDKSAAVVIRAGLAMLQAHGALVQRVEHSGPAGAAIEVTSSYDAVLQRLARMSDGIAAEGTARSGAEADDPGGGGTPPL